MGDNTLAHPLPLLLHCSFPRTCSLLLGTASPSYSHAVPAPCTRHHRMRSLRRIGSLLLCSLQRYFSLTRSRCCCTAASLAHAAFFWGLRPHHIHPLCLLPARVVIACGCFVNRSSAPCSDTSRWLAPAHAALLLPPHMQHSSGDCVPILFCYPALSGYRSLLTLSFALCGGHPPSAE